MSKLKELEKELAALIEKYGIDASVNCDSATIAYNTTVYWGCLKNVKLANELKQSEEPK